MSRRNSAPTHGWVISSQINKWMALLFMLTLLWWTFVVVVIHHQLSRDCEDTYRREFSLFGYWLQVDAGRDDPACPGPQ